jgi:myo-inositol 2-dehydrogenase/D-chiro-inositol 1-dehydrogenase
MTIESLSHDITMMTALCGNFKTVAANVQATIDSLPTFDTNSAISMQIEKGGIATISASWSSDISFSMRGYVGTKGTAIVRGGGQFDLEDCIVKTDDMPYEQVTNYHDTYDNTLAQGMANAHKHFQDALTTGSEIRTPLESGIAALKVSLAALKSDKEKIVVTL